MSRLIDVDKIDWQKGVFVNPNTDEPLPVIHKIATIEMLRDWQEEVKAIPLDRIKEAREQIIDEKDFAYADFERYKEEVLYVESDELPDDDFRYGMERCLEILNKLIAESEGKR